AGVRGSKPSSPAAKKAVGARSPDESGMLQMVPIVNEDEQEAAADPSATAFFAIPAPKSERAKSAPPPSPTSAAFAPPGGSSPMTPAPMTPPPMSQASMMGGVAPPPASMAGGISTGAPAGGISGPTSGGYGAPQPGYGGTPFGVSGQVPTQGSSVESRMQSTRVFAIIAAALFMLCMAILAAAGIVFYQMTRDDTDAPVVATAAPVATTPAPAPRADTGQVPKPKATASTKSSGSTRAASAAPAAPRVGATAPVSVTFSGATVPTTVEVACDSGFRDRGSVRGGVATVASVPTSGSCKLYPKGGVVGSSVAVRGGGSYSCTISGTTTSCK
ncbi:MAG: hypothetical protein FJ090_17245, partial [Deltaproteobacteria bacterium]|nr:hypothetical protein [Deltaproteobacteria bacterium]